MITPELLEANHKQMEAVKKEYQARIVGMKVRKWQNEYLNMLKDDMHPARQFPENLRSGIGQRHLRKVVNE